MKYGLSEKQMHEIQAILSTAPEVQSAWLFGSRAIGTYKEASDIDLALKGSLGSKTLLRLKDAFQDSDLPFFVDLLDYAQITEPALKKHVDTHGVWIYGGGEDVGVWKEVSFGDLLSEPVRNGIYKQKEFHGRGAKIVNMGELFAYPRLMDVEMKRVVLTDVEKKKSLLRNGDLIFARRSLTAEGAGKCSLVKQVIEETTFESSIIRARPNQDKSVPDFLYYHFNSPYGKHLLGTILRQVAVSGITGTDLMQLVLKIPNLPEQKAIAAVLSSFDDKIDLLHRQNKTLEAMAETLFRQWFVEKVSDCWEERSLSNIANFLNGLACQKYPPENDFEKLPVLKIRELSGGISETSDWATSKVKPEYVVEAGDVIFAWSASLMVKVWDGDRCVLNQHLFKVTSDVFPKWFYLMWCKHHLAEFISISSSHATTMGHIKRGDLDSAIVLVPSPQELEIMSAQMTPLLEKQIAIAKQIKVLETLRETLLPKLMSGEVRVTCEEMAS